jgi:hypothetical protein
MPGGHACAGLAAAVLEEITALSRTVGNLPNERAERLTLSSTIRAARRGRRPATSRLLLVDVQMLGDQCWRRMRQQLDREISS